ncbi:hypothetical protein GEMRC1_009601 [Eukaryota sp. GEM-RC1]
MQLIVIFLLVLTIVWADCRCPGRCGNGFRGTAAQCYCYCQETAKELDVSPNARCTYVAHAHFVPGSCSLCDVYISPQADGSTSVAEAFERSLSEAILPIVDANADLIFPLYRCKCPGRCESGYRGSLSQCSKWARDERHLFVNEQFKIHYFPSGGFSRGGCSVCGKTDPCKEFPL